MRLFLTCHTIGSIVSLTIFDWSSIKHFAHLGLKYANFISQWHFFYVYYFTKPCLRHYIVSHLDWWRHSMHVGFCSSFVYFCCCKYVTPMSMYQWLKWYDGSDRWVRCKECTDVPVIGGGLAIPRGLCTGEYAVGILRWFLLSDDINNQHNPWNHQHSLHMHPSYAPNVCHTNTRDIFGWEILFDWSSHCLLVYGWLRTSCTFCKSLFLNRNDIKFKLCITLLVCRSFLSTQGKCS